MLVRLLLAVVLLATVGLAAPQKSKSDPKPAPSKLAPDELLHALKAQLAEQETERAKQCRKVVFADWRDVTNTTKRSSIKLRKALRDQQRFNAKSWSELNDVLKLSTDRKLRDWRQIGDSDVRRQLQLLSRVGEGRLGKEGRKDYQFLIRDLKREYEGAKVCDKAKKNCGIRIDDLNRIMATSRDPEELEHLWDKFRDTTGRDMRSDFVQIVNWTNIVAKKNGFSDGGAMWLAEYESADFRTEVARLWEQLTPLYEQLHAFVRGRLRSQYGRSVMDGQGTIPAHLLGSMRSDNWINLLNITKPFPNKHHGDVTPILRTQGYTVDLLYRAANAFLITLGLSPVPDSFWTNSVLEAPSSSDQEMNCEPRAWDFCKDYDVRVTTCGKVSMEDMVTAHRMLAEAEYALMYSDQPHVYRAPAADGFAEAVGDALGLSVITPKHLESFGLVRDDNDPEVDLNVLMALALEKLPVLPYSYVADSWRWGVFSGDISEDELNCAWWKLRGKVQGVEPARTRSERDMDAGATYEIASHKPMIGRFVSTVLQFQLHEALCLTAGQYAPNDPRRPMYRCDIYNDHKAGAMLGRMMRLGRSRPWPDALEAATGQRELSATALRDFFQPLEDWLRRENEQKRYPIGWKSDPNEKCKRPATTTPKPSKTKSSGGGRAVGKDDRERYESRTTGGAASSAPAMLTLAIAAVFSGVVVGL